jgi:hypothetical protein
MVGGVTGIMSKRFDWIDKRLASSTTTANRSHKTTSPFEEEEVVQRTTVY